MKGMGIFNKLPISNVFTHEDKITTLLNGGGTRGQKNIHILIIDSNYGDQNRFESQISGFSGEIK